MEGWKAEPGMLSVSGTISLFVYVGEFHLTQIPKFGNRPRPSIRTSFSTSEFSLIFSQTWQVCEKVTPRKLLGKQLAARKEYRSSRLAPTDVSTLCAFLTAREKCGLGLVNS